MRKSISRRAQELARGVASTVIALAQRNGADPKAMREAGNRIDDGLRSGNREQISSGLCAASGLIRSLIPHAQAPQVAEHTSVWPWGAPTVRSVTQRQFSSRPHPASTCELRAGLDDVQLAIAALG